MVGFAAFILIIFIAVWGSMFLGKMLFGKSVSDGSHDDKLLAEVREELEMLSGRLSRMEEDMDFFKELRAPDPERKLPPGDGASEET